MHVRISGIDEMSPLKGLLLPGDVLVSMKALALIGRKISLAASRARCETVTQMLNAASDSVRSLIVSDLCNDEVPAPFDGYNGVNLPKVRRRRQRRRTVQAGYRDTFNLAGVSRWRRILLLCLRSLR